MHLLVLNALSPARAVRLNDGLRLAELAQWSLAEY